jgi:3',5'-cyclic AMP phosphodiesterase CpdA
MNRVNRQWMAGTLVLLVFAGVVGIRAVTEPNNDFRFSIVGDRTGGAAPQVYGRVWREIDLLHPDFVINVGDTIQGHNDARAEAEWKSLRQVWERYKHYPLYFTPGNHDIWNDFSRALYEQETSRPAFYSFNYQEAHFTVLDNSRTLGLNEQQLQFLEQDLKQNQEYDPKFVLFHKPYWIVLLKLRSSEFPLHRLATEYGVDYVISGHGHQFVRMVRDGIVYMEIGSSGANIARRLRNGQGFAQGWFYHHVWGRVKGSKVQFTVKEIDGPMGEGRMFRAKDWDEDGPKFDTDDPAVTDTPET